MRYIILLATLFLGAAQAQYINLLGPDLYPRHQKQWRVRGAGVLASRPATCTANLDVYICIGTGCTNGANIHYCTATNTWQAQSGAVAASTDLSDSAGLVRGAAGLTTNAALVAVSSVTDGSLVERTLVDGDIPAAITRTIASGSNALDTDAIASGACDTITPFTATGVASTDVVTWTPNADITAVTGYAPVVTGGLAIYVWPTTNAVAVKVCNPSSASITPGAISLNWAVRR